MKRVISVLLLAMSAVTVPAGADHGAGSWVQTGTILLPGPATRSYTGITELVSPCGGSIDPDVPEGIAQGVDGYWFALPPGAGGHDATLTAPRGPVPSPGPGNDVDAWFYDDACALVRPATDKNAYHMATAGSTEFGIVPQNASYVVVDLVTGANATFTFTILGMPAA